MVKMAILKCPYSSIESLIARLVSKQVHWFLTNTKELRSTGLNCDLVSLSTMFRTANTYCTVLSVPRRDNKVSKMLQLARLSKKLRLLIYSGAICPEIAYLLQALIYIAYLGAQLQGSNTRHTPGCCHCNRLECPLAKLWSALIT